MSDDVVFVNVRNDQGAAYEWDPAHHGGSASYTDFRALIRLSGFKTCELSEIDLDSNKTYIFSPNNGNVQAFLSQPKKCRAIHWEIERPGTQYFPWFDEVWVSDKTQFLMANHPKFRYVPLGGHADLGGIPQLPKVWDFCPLAYAYGDRAAKIHRLAELGYTIAPSTFDPYQKKLILAHSRFGLMLHQTPHPIMTPLRAVLFACWRLPIVAEDVGDSYPYQFIRFDDRGEIAFAMYSKDAEALAEFNYRVATEEMTFRGCIEAAL